MTENKSEELKPCPLCGCEAHDDGGGGSCMNPTCPMSAIVSQIPTIEQWNSAYCWKELDRIKAENEKVKEAYREAVEALKQLSGEVSIADNAHAYDNLPQALKVIAKSKEVLK